MYIRINSQLVIVKLFLLVCIISVAQFLGKAEAASISWNWEIPTQVCTTIYGLRIGTGIPIIFSTSKYTLNQFGSPPEWIVPAQDTVTIVNSFNNPHQYKSCHAGTPILMATFNASTPANTYAPGSTIPVSGCASMAPGGDNSAAAIALTSPPASICGASSWCCGTANITAPPTEGTFSMSLVGQYITPANSFPWSMSVTIKCPTGTTMVSGVCQLPSPTVKIWFGAFLDKIKSSLENIFSARESASLLERVFAVNK